MFGKHFASMYEGSMVGAGAIVFAVMGYIIAKQEPDKKIGSQVRLNPILLSAILGEKPEDIERAIKYLCAPDPKTTTKGNGGRRLVPVGEFDYQVVNGAKYRAIRDQEARREQNRTAKRKQREKENYNNKPNLGEAGFEKIENEFGREEAERIYDGKGQPNVDGLPSALEKIPESNASQRQVDDATPED